MIPAQRVSWNGVYGGAAHTNNDVDVKVIPHTQILYIMWIIRV